MTVKSLADPFDPAVDLTHGVGCGCSGCAPSFACEPATPDALGGEAAACGPVTPRGPADADQMLARAVESAIVRSVFGHHEPTRRAFLSGLGGSVLAGALASVIPVEKVVANIVSGGGPLEKTKLSVGFVPITCATPIIMAAPMGFYSRYGLDVDVIKTAGWAIARDKSLNGEYDASHMLTPMPLAMTMGAGSTAQPFIMPAVENINGQAIVLHNNHLDKRDPKQWKGFRFGVPFEYSMHNFLLRYYVAEHGLNPDTDIQIRVVPPPEMVANLSAGNLDGFLSPDPFNQRAVWEKVGFIHLLTKELWDGHPCCAFATSAAFARTNPNTYGALLRAIIDATQFASKAENRVQISEAIAPANYLNQPVPVIQQVLTGRFADGLGNVRDVPGRIDFDPFPWHSMGVWILTQMKRWGYISGDIDYRGIAEQVYLAADAAAVMRELGYEPPATTYKSHVIMGKTFDPADPEGYVQSFAIRRS